MENNIFTIVLLGKSGVGKSSFTNYFLDKDSASTGAGKPITGKDFYLYTRTINNIEYRLYDTWGIENGKTEEWNNYLNLFIQKNKEESRESIINLFVFCFSHETSRIEDYERKIILALQSKGYPVLIVITKAKYDLEDSFYLSIKKNFAGIEIIQVCNVNQKIGLSKDSQTKVSKEGMTIFLRTVRKFERIKGIGLDIAECREITYKRRSMFLTKLSAIKKDNYLLHQSSRINYLEKTHIINLIVRTSLDISHNLNCIHRRLSDLNISLWDDYLDLKEFCRLDTHLDWKIVDNLDVEETYNYVFNTVEESFDEKDWFLFECLRTVNKV